MSRKIVALVHFSILQRIEKFSNKQNPKSPKIFFIETKLSFRPQRKFKKSTATY